MSPVVFIVNANAALRVLVASLVRGAGWQAQSFADASAYFHYPCPRMLSCLVLDMELLAGCGRDLQSLSAEHPETPVILTAKGPTVRTAVLAMKAGAVEFMAEPLDEALLLGAVRAAFDASRETLSRQADLHALFARYTCLSLREREVMASVVAGRLNKQIAFELGITEITVKVHRSRVMRKMQANSLPELVTLAARLSPALATGELKYTSRSTPAAGDSSSSPSRPWPSSHLPVLGARGEEWHALR
jgi:FixJ family two-component response regulator